MIDIRQEATPRELGAAVAALSLADRFEQNGVQIRDLFAAFAAMVCAIDPRVWDDCLTTLERHPQIGQAPTREG